MFQFYLDGLLFPVAPEKMTVKIGNQNDTLTLISGQEVSFLKLPGLSKITFSCLLPAVRYPFAQYPGACFRTPKIIWTSWNHSSRLVNPSSSR